MSPTLKETTISRSRVAEVLMMRPEQVQLMEPENFGIPRHRRWTGTHDVYTEEGVRVLVAILRERGGMELARRLEEAWFAAVTAEQPWYVREGLK